MYRQTGDRNGETQVVNGLGDVYLAMSKLDDACIQYASALTMAEQIGDKHQEARAYHHLGDASRINGELAQAREHWQNALDRYVGLGVPEADVIRARLASPGS